MQGDRRLLDQILRERFRIEDVAVATTIRDLLLENAEQPLREVLLYSIDIGNAPLTDSILNLLRAEGRPEDSACVASLVFPVHITPLILAGIKNNYKIVLLLLNRRHTISNPHRANYKSLGKCESCGFERDQGENVESCVERIDSFRAMTSSAYIWLATHDPLLFAVRLCIELEKTAEVEPKFKATYDQLREKITKFGRSVIKFCRSEEEIHTLLTRREGTPVSASDFPLPRLNLLLRSQMRELCSDLTMQSDVWTSWMGEWANWKSSPPWKNILLRIIPHTLLYPITSLAFVFSGGTLCKSYSFPYARWLSYFSSYMLFLIFLLYLTQDYQGGNIRGFPRDPVKLALASYTWMYLAGMVFSDYLALCRVGFRRFFAVWWNWFDTLLYLCFSLAWFSFLRNDLEAKPDGLGYMERKHWIWWDSQLVAEAFYGFATVLACWRTFYFVQLDRTFGPTIISIGHCMKVVVQYIMIMLIVMFAFAAGAKYLYYGYTGYVATNTDKETTNRMNPHFLSWPDAVKSLYWAIYGYLQPMEMAVIVGDIGIGEHRETMWDTNGHWFNATVAEIILAAYHIIVMVILLNLMIAILSNTASDIIANEADEWKYIRCHIWADFFEVSNSVPPPINTVHWLLSNILLIFHEKGKRNLKFGWPDLLYRDVEANREKDKEYRNLVLTLFYRYQAAQHRDWKSASELSQDENDHSAKREISAI